jgi:hypothetical protein
LLRAGTGQCIIGIPPVEPPDRLLTFVVSCLTIYGGADSLSNSNTSVWACQESRTPFSSKTSIDPRFGSRSLSQIVSPVFGTTPQRTGRIMIDRFRLSSPTVLTMGRLCARLSVELER